MNTGRRRRHGPAGRPRQDRWSGWAAALRARHERSALRRTRPTLLLLRRLASVLQVVDRRRSLVQHTGPSIRLAIAVFLRTPVGRRPVRGRSRADAPRGRASRLQTPKQLLLAPRPLESAVSDVAVSAQPTPSTAPSELPAPLVRIVRRLRRTDDVRDVALRLMAPGGQRILRATGRHERIEVLEPHHRRRGQLLKREPPAVSAALPGPAQRRFDASRGHGTPGKDIARAFSADGEAITVASGMSVPPQGRTAAVNVEELTERVVREIDRRVVAHRERLGRPY